MPKIMRDESLCVLPEGTKAAEFFKVLAWILDRDHDLHDNIAMATKRAHTARTHNVIDDQQFLKALDIVETAARARKATKVDRKSGNREEKS